MKMEIFLETTETFSNKRKFERIKYYFCIPQIIPHQKLLGPSGKNKSSLARWYTKLAQIWLSSANLK